MSDKQQAMQVAMRGLWFQQVIANHQGGHGQFALDMDQDTLALSTFNPADALRLLIWPNGFEDASMGSEDAAAICEVQEDLFSCGTVPDMTRADWERALGRLALCLFASMRNQWRVEHGRDEIEMENVLTATDDFFALIESGFKHRTEH